MKKFKINSFTIYFISVWLLVLFFILFYISDGLAKVIRRSGGGYVPYSVILKGFFEILILIYSILTLKKTKAYFILTMFLLSLCFLIGQFFLSLSFKEINFFQNLNTLFKYIFNFNIKTRQWRFSYNFAFFEMIVSAF